MSHMKHPTGAATWGILPWRANKLQKERDSVLFPLCSQHLAQGLAHSRFSAHICSIHVYGLIISIPISHLRKLRLIKDHMGSGPTQVQVQIYELWNRQNDKRDEARVDTALHQTLGLCPC